MANSNRPDLLNQSEAHVESTSMNKPTALSHDEIVETLERLRASRRATEGAKVLIWTVLGLILALFYAFLLTTHWFSQ